MSSKRSPALVSQSLDDSYKSIQSWVVVFAGARDSYQVPLALHGCGLLNSLVTDFYAPLDHPLAAGARKLLTRSLQAKLSRRFHPGLPSRSVHSELRYTISTARHPDDWPEHADLLGTRAARIAEENASGILAYSHVASSAFMQAPNALKVLFQMQPHPISVRRCLASDKLLPQFADQSFNELTWPSSVFETFSREPLLADFCIASSSYTRKTLMENGVDEQRIRVIPYGVDLDFFVPASNAPQRFTVLFVGQLVRQKGLHYLLEAWQRLKLPNAELHIVGRGESIEDLAAKHRDGVKFLGTRDRQPLLAEYQQADLLCLPSLSDGFGLVVLEALACGTPVLTTKCCGAADLVRESENGFVIPSADVETLASRLEWAFVNRNGLRQMRSAARATAEHHPWKRFRKELAETLRSLIRPPL